MTFSYSVSDYTLGGFNVPSSKPVNVVTSNQLQNAAGPVWLSSYAYLDGLGRTRETQAPTSTTTRVVNAILFDDRGNPVRTVDAYANAAAAGSGALTLASLPASFNETDTTFDTLNRNVQVSKVYPSLTTANATSTTTYNGS
jgi:hypothetical protein